MPSKGSLQTQIFKQDTGSVKLSGTQHEMSQYEAKSQQHCQREAWLPLFFSLKINKNKTFDTIALFPDSKGDSVSSYDWMKLKFYF